MSGLSSVLAQLGQKINTLQVPHVIVTQNASSGLLSQILQGVQAGSLALTSFYQAEGAVNQARYNANQANYGQSGQQPAQYVQGGVSGSSDMMPILLLGGGLFLFAMMNKDHDKRR